MVGLARRPGAPRRPIPGNGPVRPDGVVLDPVVLDVLSQHDGVVDLGEEESRSYFKVPQPRSRDPF